MTTTQTPIGTPAEAPVAVSLPRRLVAKITTRRLGILGLIEHLVLAVIAYVPLLLVKAGVETSDTKTYLYLDPGRFLRQVATMWDPSVALGTVTHEYIGYLLPMGPFYWFFSVLGVPVWVAQRLWLGSILFAAGAGVLLLCRTFELRLPGRMVAALAFMLSPYFLQYAGRISVILLPWAGLPFMVVFAVQALRRGGWRYPALFALVVAVTSGINASSIIYVGVAPVLWLVFAVAVEHESTWREAAIVALKIGVLTLLCCLWWIVGLVVEAGYGVDVLRYTETLPSTSETSTASDVVRGLGYWYFYGSDRLGPWTQSAVAYTQKLWLLAASYLVPALSFVSAVIVRWRHRAYFVGLVVIGMVLSVGAHPYDNPTPVGNLLKQFMSRTTAGLALRSTDRATPLVVLGLAMLLGAGVSAARVRLPRTNVLVALAAAAGVFAANPSLFNGNAQVVSFFTQPAKLPGYEMSAIAHLNKTHKSTRVLAVPGNDFASYRWGDTIDTPQPAYLTRPFVTREQQVMGSIATADTLFAMDDPIQNGFEQWSSLAPMARLLSAGDVLVEYDQRYEHYGTPQPALLAQQLVQTPTGLSDPLDFGKPQPNISSFSTLDEQDLSNLTALPWPSPLVDYTVSDPRPIARGESDSGALIVAGDATGLENLAGLGMLDTDSAIYYSGTLDTKPKQLHQLLARGAVLVVTDTNRKQAFRWDTLSANFDETETPSENPAKTDPSDSQIGLFPGAPADAKTTAFDVGAINVTASSYGNPLSYTPEDRPYNAVDGNLDTSWNTGTFVKNPDGQWWQASFQNPVTADHITLAQYRGSSLRSIARVTLSFDGTHRFTTDLDLSSLTKSGQVVSFPQRTFHTLRVTIDSVNMYPSPSSATAIGFSEVEIPGQHVVEVVQMPRDLLDAAGASSIHNRLTIVMSRERVAPYPVRTDPETTISREFSLPTARTFTLSGSASLSALVPDDEIDTLVGRPGMDEGGVDAYSEGRLPGDLGATASATIDGNLDTAWQPGFGASHQKGDWLEYDLPQSITFDHLALQVVADHRHSVPTSLEISTENGTRSVNLPPIDDGSSPGATVSVPVSFPALSGRDIRVTVTGVRLEYSTNYYSPKPIGLPLGIAEIGVPGVHAAPVPPNLPGTCQSNLVSIDGQPISVAVVGPTSTALGNGEVSIVPCGADAAGITLSAGNHVVETALGHTPSTGWNVDQLTLDSALGGGPAPAAPFDSLPATQPGASPVVSVTRQAPTSEQLKVTGATGAFELVLGQSVNSGWKAVASPAGTGGARSADHAGSVDLGPPQLVDAFANGWQVTTADLRALGADGRNSFTVSLEWTPQRAVWAALAISAAAILLCIVLALFAEWWSRRRARRPATQGPPDGSRRSEPAPTRGHGPVLSNPLSSGESRPPAWAIVVVSILTGLVAGAITSPAIGAATAVATAAALALKWLRGIVTLAAVGLFIAGSVSVVAGQALHAIPESSNWPSAYETAALLIWMAVVALGADAVVSTARRWRREPAGEVSEEPVGQVGPPGPEAVTGDPGPA